MSGKVLKHKCVLIEKANLERAAEKAAESKRLRELFHLPDETKGRT